MTLSARAQKAYAYHLLRSSIGHAETGEFARRAQTPVKKALTTSVTVRAQKQEIEGTRETETIIEVFMLRDEDDDKGGVDELQTGDLYWRDSTFDADARPFSWTGEIIEHGKHYQRATFKRYNQVSQGKGIV